MEQEPTEVVHVEDDAFISRAEAEADGRTVTVRLVSYDETTTPDRNEDRIFERFRSGAFKGVDASRVLIESMQHGGPIIGRGISIEDDGKEARMTFRVSDTTAGRDLLTLINDGIARAVSVVAKPLKTIREGGVFIRESVDLLRVAVLTDGAYANSTVLSVRNLAPAEDVQESPEHMETAELQAAFDALAQRVDAVETAQAVPNVISRSGSLSLADYFTRAFDGGDDEIRRSLAENILTDQPGLQGNSTIRDVKGLVAASRPAITAFGTIPAGDAGMVITYPVIDGTAAASGYVATQASEFTEIQSGKVVTGQGSVSLKTFAGGGAISQQAIDRSDPAFMDLWSRWIMRSWGLVTEADFAAGLAGGYVGNYDVNLTSDTDGKTFTGTLFEASLAVQTATGEPGNVVVAGSNAFKLLGKTFKSSDFAIQNAYGSTALPSLTVNVAGLRVVHAPAVGANHVFIGNSLSAQFAESGPWVVTAADVAHLARNEAVYSYGASVIFLPSGLKRITVS